MVQDYMETSRAKQWNLRRGRSNLPEVMGFDNYPLSGPGSGCILDRGILDHEGEWVFRPLAPSPEYH